MQIISTASTEPIIVDVAAATAGAAVNPTTDDVSVAYIAASSTTPPGVDDWHTAAWETDTGTTPDSYTVVASVGPDGTTLAAGDWRVWIRIVHSPYTIIRPAGLIRIQ